MPIYLDNSATTRVRQEVVNAMLPYLTESWGNPSSIHAFGRQSKEALQKARAQVAALLNCAPEEVYFSPCGTVSNNVALIGRARFAEANGLGRHLITSAIEHPAILGPAKYLESSGWKVTCLPVDKEGFVSVEDFERAITSDTSIVSIMWANNEIGNLQPIKEMAAIAASKEIFFHTDAVQAVAKISIDLSEVPVHSLSLSGHKFHAPKGIGALFVRRLSNLMPLMFGGGQEMGMMPGTEGLANIVALGMAAELAMRDLDANRKMLFEMQSLLFEKLRSVPGVRFTGTTDFSRRLPGHISIVLPGAEGEGLVLRADMRGVCVSSGSACHQGIIEPSQVLKALGLSDKEALGSMRISAGTLNNPDEVASAAETLVAILQAASSKVQAVRN